MTHSTPVSIGVGFDTARYGHHVSFLRSDLQPAAKAFTFAESPAGYAELRQALEQLQKKYGSVHFAIRIDAAGQYAANLERFLRCAALGENNLGRPAQAESGLLQGAFSQTQSRPRRVPGVRPLRDRRASGSHARDAASISPSSANSPAHWRARPSRPRAWSTSSTIAWLASFRSWRWRSPTCGGLGAAVARQVPHPGQDRRCAPVLALEHPAHDGGQCPEDSSSRSANRGQPQRSRRGGVDPPIGPVDPAQPKNHTRAESVAAKRPTTTCRLDRIRRSKPSRGSASRRLPPWWPKWSASTVLPLRSRSSITSGFFPKRTPPAWTNSAGLCPRAPCA